MKRESTAGPGGRDRSAPRLILFLGTALGIACFGYYYSQGLTVAHYDAKAHLLVARRIVDSLTPGYVQMGSHWLPFTHILYLPFVLFESQYRSGVLPSLLSVCAFALSGWLVCRISHRITGSMVAGTFAGVMLLANANLQYLQSCPLTEPLYMLLLLLALDGLIRWRGGESGEVPWLTAAWISLGCLCRYEGWYVLGGVLLLLAWDVRSGLLTRRKALRAAFLFILAFLLPVALHFGYIYWSVQDSFLLRVAQGNPAPSETFRRPFLSLAYHLGELAQIAAVLSLAAGIAGVIYCLGRRDRLRRTLPLFLLWLPSLINISALYWGMIYRVRYSVLLLPAIAVFASVVVSSRNATRRVFMLLVMLALALPWISWISPQQWSYHALRQGPGILILPSAAVVLYLVACGRGRSDWPLLILCVVGMQVPVLAGENRPILDETLEHSLLEPERRQVLEHLLQNYDGAPIIVDSLKLAPLIYDSGLPLRSFICNEGNKSLWRKVMQAPEREAGWIITLQGDEVQDRLHVDPHWADEYALVSRTESLALYHSKSRDR